MKYTIYIIAVISSCVPKPENYCTFTCHLSEGRWTSRESFPDPNDHSRIPWCVCEINGRQIGLPPQNPNR